MNEDVAIKTEEATNASPPPQSVYVVKRDYDFPDDRSCSIVGIYKSPYNAREKWQLTIGKMIDEWDEIEDKDHTTINKILNMFRLYDDCDGYWDEVSIVQMELK